MRKLISIIAILLHLIFSQSIMSVNSIKVARTFCGDDLGGLTYSSFCMDSFGFMWIGTDNGLFRFDGNHYKVYRHQEGKSESLSDNRIMGLVHDIKGRIWVATANGLNLYDFSKDSFKRISVPDFGEKGYIISITADEEGKITFVVAGVGIYEIVDLGNNDVSAEILDPSDVIKDVNTLLSHTDKSLYAGTKDGVIFQFSKGKGWKKVADLGSAIFDMREEHNGAIIINSSGKVFRFNPISKKMTKIHLDTQIPVNNLSSSVGEWMYLATYGAGLWKLNMASDVALYCDDVYSPFINLKKSRIGAVWGANDGSLWIGDDYVGVVMVPLLGNSFIYRKITNIIKDFDVPLTAMKVWKGNTLIGNCSGEVAIISPAGAVLRDIKIPGSKSISSIYLTDDDNAILGVLSNSVWQLDLNTGVIKKVFELSDQYLSLMVCQGNDGSIYVGAYAEGLLKYNPKTGEKIWISPDDNGRKLLSPFITTLKSYDDRIWIGAYGGIACYNVAKNTFDEIDQSPYLACAVFDIVQENKNIFLIATSDGLVRYDISTKEIKKFTTLDGLSDNDVRSIAIDGYGGKWIGTMQGISYQPPREEGFIQFAGGNGMAERSFEAMEYYAENNMLYSLNRKGLTTFSPDSIKLPKFPESLKISDIYVNGKSLNPKDLSGHPNEISLSYDENSIAFRISTMDFRDTSNLTYFWRFADDEDWVELPGGSDLINLSSLAPGRYSLQFKAREAGVESPVSEIIIRIAHPWYLSWFAKTIYVFIFLVIVCLILIIMRKRQQERLHAKKIEFFMDMSHDMRSPLSLILNPLETLLKDNLSNDVRKKIRGVYRNAHRILNTVNQLLDLKKIDYGRRRLQCHKTNIKKFIEEIVEMFQPQAQLMNISLTFDSEEEWEDVWIDCTVLDRIMFNLISNALKFTPKNGRVEIKITKSKDQLLGDCLEILVLDNGIGLDSKRISDIFRRHYRSEAGNSYTEDGYGLGLDICRRYAVLHHGKILATNRRDDSQGSLFVVIIPLSESAYESEELISDNSIDMEEGIKSPSGRVLVVEDDTNLRDALFDYLKISYDVLTARDGAEGYEIAQSTIPDVIITDVKMPRIDGLQLLKHLKSNKDLHHIPVVVLSTKSEVDDRVSGLHMGAEAYLGKPFDFNELNAIVNNLIDGRRKMAKKYSEEEVGHAPSIPIVKGNDEFLIERVNKILDERLVEEDMNVDRLADAVGVSRTHLYRRMKERLGINPSEYIRNLRLQKACELLKNDDLDITQIAYALGFSSQSQFSTSFKRFMGITPSEYRTKHKK